METRHPTIAARDDSVLVLIDCQERLWPVIRDADALAARLATLLKGAALLDVPVLVTEQYPKGLGPTIPGLLDHVPAAQRVEKMDFSCGREPGFRDALRETERGTVVLCGVETHICVAQTALDALASGYRVQVVADGCGTRHESNHEIALDRLARAGAVVTALESILFEWMTRCDHAAFKAVSGLLK